MAKTSKPRVAVAWLEGKENNDLCALSGYDGVRVYDKDEVDPRIEFEGPLPYFDNMAEAIKYMRTNPTLAVQVEIKAFNRGVRVCPEL